MSGISDFPAYNSGSEAESSGATGYERLAHGDRHAAGNLQRYFEIVMSMGRSKTLLADRAVTQSVVTALPLAISDFLSLYISVFAATGVFERLMGISTYQVEHQTAFFISLTILPIAHLAGLYPGIGDNPIVEFRQVARSLFAAVAVLAGVGWFCFPEQSSFYVLSAASAYAIALPLAVSARFFARKFASRFSWWGAPTLILAEPRHAEDLYDRLVKHRDQGFRPVGVLLDQESDNVAVGHLLKRGVPVCHVADAREFAFDHSVTYVIVSECAGTRLSEEAEMQLCAIPNRVLLSNRQFDLGIWDHLYSVGSRSGLRISGAQPSSVELLAKRVIDLFVSLSVLIILSPLWLLICIAIWRSSRGGAFYGQRRVGQDGVEFTAWKFRSMVANADKVLDDYLAANPAAMKEWDETHKLAKDPRITWIGKFLRSSSLDEIPQLWNVVKGEMSLVGPRPVVDSPTYDAEYIREYDAAFEAYKSVPPGLTGLWQIRSRNKGVYHERIYYDMYYIRNWCIWLDLYIIMRTVRTVAFREGT